MTPDSDQIRNLKSSLSRSCVHINLGTDAVSSIDSRAAHARGGGIEIATDRRARAYMLYRCMYANSPRLACYAPARPSCDTHAGNLARSQRNGHARHLAPVHVPLYPLACQWIVLDTAAG